MKISIVTPTYNSEEYIQEALESIHDQSYRNFEHIVIDGLSKDKTVEIVESFAKKNSIRIVSERDKGQSEALNKGFKMISGDILAWQNSDDLYFKDTFQIVVDFFREYPDVDVAYGYYQLIDSKGAWICDVFPISWNRWLFAHGRFCPPQPAVFWRRKVWDQIGPLNQDLQFCMDVDFYSRAICRGFKFGRIPKMMGKFRVHDASKTQNKENERKVHNEYKSVLVSNFRLSAFGQLIFELFQIRSKLAGKLKQKFLRKI